MIDSVTSKINVQKTKIKMDSILFNYSEFFNDDGGMDKVKSDFAKLGDDLISEAKRIKKEFN